MKGFKQTEIGRIPEDWEVLSIEELIDLDYIEGHLDGNHGALYPKSHEFIQNGIPYVGANSLYNGRIDFSKVKFLSKERADTFIKGVSIPNDVLFAHNATVGPVGCVGNENEKIILSTTLTYFRTNSSKLFYRYLFYEFQAERFVKQYVAIMSQSTRNQVPITAQKKFEIAIPKLPEQQAIAEALSDADHLIEKLEKLIAKKRLIKEGAMQKLLTPKEGWEKDRLNNNVWFQEGPGVRKYQFKRRGVKLLNGTNINKGNLNLDSTNRYISESEAYGAYNHFLVDDGDILIACSGVTIEKFHEKVTICNSSHLPLCMNTSTMRFKIISDKISKPFFFHFLKSNLFKDQIQGQATGSAQLNFGPAHINLVDLIFPKSLSEQTRIAGILSDMDSELEVLEKRLEKTHQIKQGMMQEVLTGRIRLPIKE